MTMMPGFADPCDVNAAPAVTIIPPVQSSPLPCPVADVASLADSSRQPVLARVLHVVNGEHYAGAERVQDLLALRLPELGYEVSLACIKPDKFPRLRRCQDTPLYEVPMRGRFDLTAARQLASLVQTEGFELIHSHTPRSAMLASYAAWRTGAIHIHHLHSPTSADTTHFWRNWVNVWIEKCSLSRAKAVIAVSQSLGEYALRRGMSEELVSVVPNGVPRRGELVARPTPAGVWTLGMVALFRPRKGIEVLLEALARLKQRGHQVRLRAIGTFETPEYQAAIEAQAAALDVDTLIDWRGFRSDVDAELAGLDLFVLPSLFGEGLPMVVLEAMAAGVPIVGTRVEGVPEAIRGGTDGIVALPGSAESLSEGIEKYIDGSVDWQAMRASAHRRQAERFSDLSMSRGVADVYGRVLRNCR